MFNTHYISEYYMYVQQLKMVIICMWVNVYELDLLISSLDITIESYVKCDWIKW